MRSGKRYNDEVKFLSHQRWVASGDSRRDQKLAVRLPGDRLHTDARGALSR